jgi:hypothetical protein
MAEFIISISDVEMDGTVDVKVSGYAPGDPATAAVNIGAHAWNHIQNVFTLLDVLGSDPVTDPPVEAVLDEAV